ncbi:MAG: glycoside hydrolase family 5 protein [Chitinophagaceae bacterium]
MKKNQILKSICYALLLTIILCINLTNKLNAQLQPNYRIYGITLSGAEFGENRLPGVMGKDYIYPSIAEIAYFASKGVDIIQLPFKWERVQKHLGASLDENEVAYISKFIDDCATYNISVNLVLQNFGRYNINGVAHIVGGNVVTAWHLADFWKKMALFLSNKQNVYSFSIMTEPHGMTPYHWPATVQQVINSIREVDRNTIVIVDGDNYSNPATWEVYNNDLKYVLDPANKLVFNAHCYFDKNCSGKYAYSYDQDGATEWTGVERMKPFVNWLNQNGRHGYVGEFGIPKNDRRWIVTMKHFLEYLQENNIGASYWAAGSWWKDYPLSIQPVNNQDQPQLIVFSKYFNKSYQKVIGSLVANTKNNKTESSRGSNYSLAAR